MPKENVLIIAAGFSLVYLGYICLRYIKIYGLGVYYAEIILGIAFIILGVYQTLKKRFKYESHPT